jgi:hypothetical protein
MSLKTKEQLELLAEKKLRGIITPEEQEMLNEWLNHPGSEQITWDSGDKDELALRKRLLKSIREDAGIRYRALQIQKVPYYWRVAAVILLLLTGGLSYFLFSRRQEMPIAVTRKDSFIQDKAPGHNGAILTLAEGKKIVLDSAGSGKIAIQGTAILVKQNGLLTYQKRVTGAFSGKKSNDNQVIYNTITTPRGRQFELVLSDGSKIWLNAASSITYPAIFSSTERKVEITGEAYFEVAKDAHHPFIVSAGNGEVLVLGTRFNVMAYPDEKLVKATLLEGSVKIIKDSQKVVLDPGEQASFLARSDRINVKEVDTKHVVDWVKGRLSLNDLDVKELMREISRWYDVDVEFDGPIPQGNFWGIINRNVNLSNVLDVMRANGLNVRLEDNKVIISSK